MATYINIGNTGFQEVRNGEYVDKSGLIAIVNRTLFTQQKFSCVTRCRRFGKAIAAKRPCSISYDREAKTHSCQIEHWTV